MCCFFFEIMKQLNKGFNVVKNIVGSSYIIEIDELSKKYQNTLIILDNNHQIDPSFSFGHPYPKSFQWLSIFQPHFPASVAPQRRRILSGTRD